MSDPYVREIGQVRQPAADYPLTIGVDHDTVTIGGGSSGMFWRLTATQVEELARLLVSATWQAAAYQGDVQGQLEAGAAAGGAA